MFKHFFYLEWKSFFRSASLGRSLALKIVMFFIALYFLSAAFIIGISIYPILKEKFPEQQPMYVFNNFIAFWFLWELTVRFMFQSLPVVNAKPLLVNNVRKNKIIHYILTKTIFSPFNWVAPLIFIPFGVWVIVLKDFSFFAVLSWWIAMLALVLCANFINFLLIKKFSENLRGLLPYIVMVLILVALDYFKIFNFGHFVGKCFLFLLDYPFLAVVPVILVLGIYILNFNNLTKSFYLDSALKGKSEKVNTSDFEWLKRFGNIAPFLQLDFKLIWRNKRTKSVLWTSLLFVAYGLLFYTNPSYSEISLVYTFAGTFITGTFLFNFGQFVPAWDSTYYAMLMTQNISFKQYIESKAILFYLSIVALFILSTPYVYFGKHILLIHLSCALYNAGINVPTLLYFGAYNKKRIDLNKSSFLNYQGTGMAQWLAVLPILIIPLLVWGMLQLIFDDLITTSVAFGFVGIMGLIFRNYLINAIARKYKSRKYVTISGFKEEQ